MRLGNSRAPLRRTTRERLGVPVLLHRFVAASMLQAYLYQCLRYRICRSTLLHGGRQNTLAACACTSALREGSPFRNSEHVRKGALLPRGAETAGIASRTLDCGQKLWLETRCMGRLLEPLSFGRTSTREGHGCFKSYPDARRSSYEDVRLGEQAGQGTWPSSVVQFSGNAADLSKVIFR